MTSAQGFLDALEAGRPDVAETFIPLPRAQVEIYFDELEKACGSRIGAPFLRRPANALNVEIGAPLPRCLSRPPADWPDGMALRWRASGGDALVFGLCCASKCPLGR